MLFRIAFFKYGTAAFCFRNAHEKIPLNPRFVACKGNPAASPRPQALEEVIGGRHNVVSRLRSRRGNARYFREYLPLPQLFLNQVRYGDREMASEEVLLIFSVLGINVPDFEIGNL